LSGRGSAWLERLVRDQEVGGSNPLAPTNYPTSFPLNCLDGVKPGSSGTISGPMALDHLLCCRSNRMSQASTNRVWPLTPIAAGTLLICVAVGGYVLMHVFFFGVPHFTLATAMGKSEIGYALSILVMVGIGVFSIYRGFKGRRA
jgi:hypothetical protein